MFSLYCLAEDCEYGDLERDWYAITHITERLMTLCVHVCVYVCAFNEMVFLLLCRLREDKKNNLNATNIPIEPNNETSTNELNSSYDVATDENPYHLYETIPEVPREYEVPNVENKQQAPIYMILEPSTHNDEGRQKVRRHYEG